MLDEFSPSLVSRALKFTQSGVDTGTRNHNNLLEANL